MVREIVNGYNFIDGWQAGWNEELQAYLIQVGVLGPDGVSKGWSYLEVKYNEIKAAVDSLEMFTDDEGNPVTYEALQALIDARIQNGIAELDLDTKWALLDADHNELEWMMSGFRSQASQYDSFAQMYSAGLTQNNDSLTAAIMTEVDNRISTAKAEIGAQVNDNLAGYVAYSDLDHAIATMFADNGEATAAITAKVNGAISTISLSADQIMIDGLVTLENWVEGHQYEDNGVHISDGLISVYATDGGNTTERIYTDVGAGVITMKDLDQGQEITLDAIHGYIAIDNGDGLQAGITGDFELTNGQYLHVVGGIIVGIDL